jgi:hypothetical protein
MQWPSEEWLTAAWLRAPSDGPLSCPRLESVNLSASQEQLETWLLALVLADQRQLEWSQVEVDILVQQLQEKVHSDAWVQRLLEQRSAAGLLYLLRWTRQKGSPRQLPTAATVELQLTSKPSVGRLEYLEKFLHAQGGNCSAINAQLRECHAAIDVKLDSDPLLATVRQSYSINRKVLYSWWDRSDYDIHVQFRRDNQLEMAYLMYTRYRSATKSWMMWLMVSLEALCRDEAQRCALLPQQIAASFVPCYALLWLGSLGVPLRAATIREHCPSFGLFYRAAQRLYE